MARRLSVAIRVDGELDRERQFAFVRAADEAGVETVFVPETWGRDAFSLLVQLAERTTRIQVGTGIVNVFSRSPAALAQQFATLDELSGGRAIAGLGTSGPRVIEHFHGLPYERPLTRVREVIAIMRMLFAEQPLAFDGRLFRLERGFTFRFKPLRARVPIYLASFRPPGLQLAAEAADGLMPLMIPVERLAEEVGRFRERVAAAGRDPSEVVYKAPGQVVVTSDDGDAARHEHKRTLAFYMARMGDFYHTQLSEMGWAAEVAAVREAWAAGGSGAGAGVVPDRLSESLAAIGPVERCIERLDEQAAAGVDLHGVSVSGIESPAELRRTFERLVG
ncbi:MAG TPA: LLM class flavin-dependent oxidoreductase [Chloroflexota bacterium]|nr:LLM class flavin-dependent oxidoreductase [Chloroflexota bacterium]